MVSSASAQVPIGGQLETHNQRPARFESADSLSVRKTAHQFAICAAVKHRRLAEEAVDFPASRPGLSAAVKKVATSDCLVFGSLRFEVVGLRAALFEALYRSKFGHGPPRDLSRAESIDFGQWYPAPLTDHGTVLLAFVQMGECATRRKQTAAWKLVMSEPGSIDEQDAIAELQPALPGCLPKGLTFHVSVDMLRGGIAEALYRLSERAPVMTEH
jgi:hypothetical protein